MYCDLWPYVLWPFDFQIQKRIVSAETIWGNTVPENEISSIFHNIPWCNFHHKYICLFFILESQFPTIWDQPAVQLILKVFYERSFCKKKVARKEWRFYSSPRNAMGRCNMAIDMCQKWNSITPPSVTHFWHLTYLGAVHKLCRLKIGRFLTPSPPPCRLFIK